MRQRLSAEPDRYRGRRRQPVPSRSRFALAGAAALVGAGVVAAGAATNLPDIKAVSPAALQILNNGDLRDDLADRSADAHRASRGDGRNTGPTVTPEQAEAEAWHLPLDDFTFTSPYGVRVGKLHAGVDLAAPEGTPYQAIHAGEVSAAGYQGGYGYAITIRQDDNTEVVYAHSRRLFVRKGDRVRAGQVIGEVGNTGNSYGPHLHIETHVDGRPTDPIPLLRDHGIDVRLKTESVYGDLPDGT